MTRRLVGRFTLSEEHMHQWFDDTIGLTGDWRKPGPVYAIPFGCLRAVETANLLVAGRCISADHESQASLRIQQTCLSLGQAAGTAAAMSLAAGISPRELDPRRVAAQLEQDRRAVEPAFALPFTAPHAE